MDSELIKINFFTYEGRLNRKPYFFRSLILVAITVAVQFLDVAAEMADSTLLTLFILAVSVGTAVSSIMLSIRRLHDFNRSGYWILLNLIPVVNIFFACCLFILPGTKGANSYGHDPLK